jgi:hypothetical protein
MWLKAQHTFSLTAAMYVELLTTSEIKEVSEICNPLDGGRPEYPTVRTGLGSVLCDLDDADEEDLFMELRKVEILQSSVFAKSPLSAAP